MFSTKPKSMLCVAMLLFIIAFFVFMLRFIALQFRYIRHPVHLGGPCIGELTEKTTRNSETGVEVAVVKVEEVLRSTVLWHQTAIDCREYNQVKNFIFVC